MNTPRTVADIQALPAFAVAQAIAARAMMPPAWPYEQGEPASTQGGPAWQDMGSQSVRNGRNLFGYLDANPQGPTPFNR